MICTNGTPKIRCQIDKMNLNIEQALKLRSVSSNEIALAIAFSAMGKKLGSFEYAEYKEGLWTLSDKNSVRSLVK